MWGWNLKLPRTMRIELKNVNKVIRSGLLIRTEIKLGWLVSSTPKAWKYMKLKISMGNLCFPARLAYLVGPENFVAKCRNSRRMLWGYSSTSELFRLPEWWEETIALGQESFGERFPFGSGFLSRCSWMFPNLLRSKSEPVSSEEIHQV